MADYIERKAAIEALNKQARDNFNLSSDFEHYLRALQDAVDNLKALPSAERKGLWVESNPQNSEICRLIKCSECGKGYIVGFNVPYAEWTERHKFCVECGARMEVEHE